MLPKFDDMHRASIHAWHTETMILVYFSPTTRGYIKGSSKNETRFTRRVDRISSGESEHSSKVANSFYGDMFGNTIEDGINFYEQYVVVVDEEMQ